MAEHQSLPDFADPPVIETVLGIEFAPMIEWDAVKYGLFWETIRAEYPAYKVVPPMGPRPGLGPGELASVQDFLMHLPIRCWFMDDRQVRLIQVQNDRFVHNWRKVGDTETYPHYEIIRPLFQSEWERFNAFLNSQKIPAPQLREFEITYVNHLEKGKGWRSFSDIGKVVSVWRDHDLGSCISRPESLQIVARYPLSEGRGQITVTVQPALRDADAREVLQLTLTARGRAKSADVAEILKWFDIARVELGQAFLAFTTDDMHKLWQRRA